MTAKFSPSYKATTVKNDWRDALVKYANDLVARSNVRTQGGSFQGVRNSAPFASEVSKIAQADILFLRDMITKLDSVVSAN